MAVPNCQLCTRPVSSSSLVNNGLENASAHGKLFSKSVKHLWSYLYHQNVRETLSPSLTERESCELPMLAFTMYWGGEQSHYDSHVGGSGGEQTVQLCWQCYEHIDKLDQLHQQLEQVKALVEVQVKRIDNLCQSSGRWSGNRGNDLGKMASHSIFQAGKSTSMSMAGVSSGKENIAQLIQFMATICEGMPTSVAPPKRDSPSLPENRVNSNGLVKIDQESNELVVGNSETSRYFISHCGGGVEIVGNQYEVTTAEEVNVATHYHHHHQESSVDHNTYRKDYTVLRAPGSYQTVEFVDVTVTVDPAAVDDNDDSNSVVSNTTAEYSAALPSTSMAAAAARALTEDRKDRSTARRPRRKRKKPALEITTCSNNSSSDTSAQNVKPCPVCGKFIKKNHMIVHMRVHTREKPFRCELCDSRFSQKSHLTTHQRLHTGECPYTCEVCFESFHRRDKLKKHKLREHRLYS